ncbi:hypothetical protein LLB_2251 [Legionella longbeachae D-4968]|nr:hypothetical protein LLB_2251 [Legionella longbeachae D-4968]
MTNANSTTKLFCTSNNWCAVMSLIFPSSFKRIIQIINIIRLS